MAYLESQQDTKLQMNTRDSEAMENGIRQHGGRGCPQSGQLSTLKTDGERILILITVILIELGRKEGFVVSR